MRVKRLQKGLKSSLNRIYVTYSMAARDVWHIHALALGATPLGPRDMYMPYITHCHAISITYTIVPIGVQVSIYAIYTPWCVYEVVYIIALYTCYRVQRLWVSQNVEFH